MVRPVVANAGIERAVKHTRDKETKPALVFFYQFGLSVEEVTCQGRKNIERFTAFVSLW